MTGPEWISRLTGTHTEPPRTGKGATTDAWRHHAERLGYKVPTGARRSQIIDLVDAGPPPVQKSPTQPRVEGPVYASAVAAVAAAGHLTDMDQPTVAVLLDLAQCVDGMSLRPASSPIDNWTVPTFLRYLESLGLTPASRQKLDVKPPKAKSALEQARDRWGGRAG